MSASPAPTLSRGFALSVGLLLGLSLLKFGNPVVLNHLVKPPDTFLEWVFQAWPTTWFVPCLIGVAVMGLTVARWKWPSPQWLLALPLVWLGWQFVAATQTVDPKLTQLTLVHFVSIIAIFFLGLLSLAQVGLSGWFWSGLLGCFLFMVWTGFEQHYGGLEATRKMVMSQPGWENLGPDHLKRLASNRIFATLLYPNTLAGIILLLLPPLASAAWRLTAGFRPITRGAAVGLLLWSGLSCLIWSGSKAGWLIALVQLVIVALRSPFPRFARWAICLMVITCGLAGFFSRFSSYLEKGATSVSARQIYWKAALQTFRERPVFGAGPGTFSVTYARIKPPEAEMARLTHNDYLEQASDSGLIGFLTFTAFILGSLAILGKACWQDRDRFPIWLGLLAWAFQSTVEFGLYIPAVSATAFCLLGWLWGTHKKPTTLTRGDGGPPLPPASQVLHASVNVAGGAGAIAK